MNNQQFRRLLFETEQVSPRSHSGHGTLQNQHNANNDALGSRARASILMTPRNLGNGGSSGIGGTASEIFARQLKERGAQRKSQNKTTVSHSVAPKGSRLAAGYTDRAQQLRESQGPSDSVAQEGGDKASRIKALEDMLKLGQIDLVTFEKLRDEITGGDLANVHLVKGLDRKLLARARAGEDVYNPSTEEETGNKHALSTTPDDELDELLHVEVSEREREIRQKHGVLPPASRGNKKRTRDDILREMKEARAAALPPLQGSSASPQALGGHFKRIANKDRPGTSRIEVDSRGREILIIVDEKGNVKRKTRKPKASNVDTKPGIEAASVRNVQPLGDEVEVPALPQEVGSHESDDIFSNAGSDYNPLGDMADELDDQSEDEGNEVAARNQARTSARLDEPEEPNNPSAKEAVIEQVPRNYFGDVIGDSPLTPNTGNPMNDPTVLAAIKRASLKAEQILMDDVRTLDVSEGVTRPSKIRARIAERDRDADDIDMGFGSSRFEDQDDGEARPVKLAKWKGLASDPDHGGHDAHHKARHDRSQRKRGTKERRSGANGTGAIAKSSKPSKLS